MYPEDRVLVAYVPRPADFALIEREGWYRIPQVHAPKGLYAEYIAFYFGRHFGTKKWAIHYYAPNLGHELVTRRELLPDEPDHPRADAWYYKVQLGDLCSLSRPIMSLRWRRITFFHTTGDRFQDAVEINDLFLDGGEYVDRLYTALKERGLHPERNYRIEEPDLVYDVPLTVLCRNGRCDVPLHQIPQNDTDLAHLITAIEQTAVRYGGIA